MGSSFGERLKQERLSRNLTQGELGGVLYSANYISLLENAHREPTAEIIRQLVTQLQAGHSSAETGPESASPADAECLRLSLCARQSWDIRDYAGAATSALSAAVLAQEANAPLTWWNMTFLAAHSMLRGGEHTAAAGALETLLAHPITRGSNALGVRAHQVMASTMLSLGKLPESITHATKAVDIGPGDSPEEFSAYLLALQSLIGALTEAGRLDEAWEHALVLAESIPEDTPPQIAGEIHWVIGNVAFIRNDTCTGLEHHGKAARLLSPTADLSRWAQFNKATAWVRLKAGIVEPETLQAIERSELAHSVVGATPAESLEVELLRARWNFLNGDTEKALKLVYDVEARIDQLPPHIAGDSVLLLGDTLQACGRADEARDAYVRARERYTEAGAFDRAEIAEKHLAGL